MGREVIPTPWRGRFWNYEEHGGMLVPVDAEVACLLPEGAKPYWRGHISTIRYEHPQEPRTSFTAARPVPLQR